jgi:hypothetical protein
LGYKQDQIDTVVQRLKYGNERGKDIIVRLNSLIDRDEMLKALRKLVWGSDFSIVPELPPPLSKLSGELFLCRADMSDAEKKDLVYLTKQPFLKLVTKK